MNNKNDKQNNKYMKGHTTIHILRSQFTSDACINVVSNFFTNEYWQSIPAKYTDTMVCQEQTIWSV